MTRPMELLYPLAKRWALTFGLYLRWATASSTLARFFSETVGILLITRETVVMETLARRATSSMLNFFFSTVQGIPVLVEPAPSAQENSSLRSSYLLCCIGK